MGVPRVVESETEQRPWMPDSFIDWIEPRLTKDTIVFEWGSGNSTLWLARRVDSVTAVEHHVLWAKALESILPDNVTLRWDRNAPGYERCTGFVKDQVYIVDGVRRDDCIHAAANWTRNGVIILDNSDSDAKEGQQWLRQQGFSEKVFSGEYQWSKDGEVHTTTIFYRNGNCLRI